MVVRVHCEAQAINLLHNTPGVNIDASYVAAGRHVHNSYLEALTELGPVGLALLALVIGLSAWRLLCIGRGARASDEPGVRILSTTLLLMLGSFAVSMIFLSITFNKPLWILVGLTLALDRAAGHGNKPEIHSQAGRPTAAGQRTPLEEPLPSRY